MRKRQQPVLVIHSKELAKKVLVKDFDNFQNRYSYPDPDTDPLGTLNLFTVRNPIWSAMKHELRPMFTTLRLKGITELMNINSAELVRRIQIDYIENKKPVNLRELFSMYTSDTVGYTAFGLRVSVLKDLTSPVWYITRDMVEWSFWRGFEFTMIFFAPALAKLMRLKFFSASATAYIKQLFWSVAEKRQKLLQPNDKDLLNHLMKLKENLKLPVDTDTTDNLIVAQAALFILGAIDTSAATLCYLLHELAHHPEEQEKLFKEVSTALEEKGKSVLDYNDLLELSYLTGCIKETLRKYSPVPFLDRICCETYKLTDEVTLEKGTPIYVNVSAIHYNEEYYPNPQEWHPERFEGATENDNHNFTFLTFGEGPRVCLGKRYGYMQLRTAMAHMVMEFRFEPAEPYLIRQDPYSVALSPFGGGKVKFVPR
ncbi:unnamed protein product [Arctia plantaginis]|uniref:unspecific monooxygenase n=1 Tax=Arctia plantaginis TaxID=874455 RepID=A0A8S1AKP3_ARCPL|nr:unnamed protein product [Arctia plantaginis]